MSQSSSRMIGAATVDSTKIPPIRRFTMAPDLSVRAWSAGVRGPGFVCRSSWSAIFTLLVLGVCVRTGFAESPRVQVVKTPNDGIQPQALSDGNGVVHLIYFKGEPGGGD